MRKEPLLMYLSKRAGGGASPAAGEGGSPPGSHRRGAGRVPALRAREGVRVCRVRQPEWYRELRLFVPGRQAFFLCLPRFTLREGTTIEGERL